MHGYQIIPFKQSRQNISIQVLNKIQPTITVANYNIILIVICQLCIPLLMFYLDLKLNRNRSDPVYRCLRCDDELAVKISQSCCRWQAKVHSIQHQKIKFYLPKINKIILLVLTSRWNKLKLINKNEVLLNYPTLFALTEFL